MTATDSVRSNWRAYAAAVPVVFVNTTAFIGQFAFLRAHVPWIVPGQVLIAVAIESIAIYYAWHAHLATLANDSAMRLKLAAYSFAAIVGVMNYSHYAAPHWRPTALAVIMFIASAISPWLWAVHTRRASRDQLMARRMIDEHAVRLGGNRWTWHPYRSIRVTSWAAWHGISEPARAIAQFADRYGTADSEPEGVPLAQTELLVPVAVPEIPAAVPGIELEPVPLGLAVAYAIDSVPAETVPDPVLVPEPEGVPLAQVVPSSGPGLEFVPAPGVTATIVADAVMEADATLSGGRPAQDMIDQAEMVLMATSLDDLPSIRWVAKNLLGDPNQRRLASKLLDSRKAAGTGLAPEPASTQHVQNGTHTAPGMIASPAAFQPGGVNG
jgi:hypothetical protein